MRDFAAEACDRALAAKSDYLGQLPGHVYRRVRDDIDTVWDMLESPIEQVALLQLASANYARSGPAVYAKVAPERGMHSHYHYKVQLIPQVKFGPYRVDFLYDFGAGARSVAVECDGEQFHVDKDRDAARDAHLREHFNVSVLRMPGRNIWRNNDHAAAIVGVISSRII